MIKVAVAKAEGICLSEVKSKQCYIVQHTQWVKSVIEHAGACLPVDHRLHVISEAVFGMDPNEAAVACVFQVTENGERVNVFPESLADAKIKLPPGLSSMK